MIHTLKKLASLIAAVCLLMCVPCRVHSAETVVINFADTCFVSTENLCAEHNQRPNPIFQLFKAKQKKNKKTMAVVLAFPFPFGIVGLHRIYLGTAPHVPVVYIGTFGGALGILPFIDFCVLALDKDIDRFIENKKVLMWVDENKKPQK